MNIYKYTVKKLLIGSAIGAALFLGSVSFAMAQSDTKDGLNSSAAGKTIDTTAEDRAKLKSAGDKDEAKAAVRAGYAHGFKRGQKDGGKSSKYNAKVLVPNEEESPSDARLSRKYKPFYGAGYTRGYEDGYNKTTKYGEMSGNGGDRGYSVHVTVIDELVGGNK